MRFLCVFVLVLFSALPGSAQLKTMYPHGRLDPALAQKWERRQLSDSLTVSLSLRSTGRLHQPGFPARVLQHYDRYPIVYARVAARDLLWLATDTALSFIQEYHAPREELTTGAFDPTLNRIRFAQHRYPGLSGAGLNVLVKERRLDTADIDLRQRIVRTGREAAEQTSHASLMATIIAGAGNSSPFARGAAPGAGVGSVSFTHLLPEPDTLMQRLRFPVTNHSYGTVPESFYGNEAAAYDRQVHTFPQQLHVFSAGNAGSATISSGPYAGLPGASTLTGNFKSAKNVLVVGAVDSLGEPMDGSSRGPAHDGRLKPELVAFGEDGSSGAAAAVSGIALLVQDAYRQRHGDSLPPAALVKAVLVTTAADAGIPGPDYITGHGRADAEKAVRLMLEGSHFTGTISAGQTARHLLPIPSGTGRLRATLAWTDPPAQPGASRALVHDLDLRLIAEGTGTAWLPWVLSGNREEWTKGAERKRDTLNNLEHISLEGPASGTYAVEITAPASVTGLQEYTVAFFREAADTGYFIFPTASDPLQAGRTHLVRWECSAPGTATLEVAVNGGAWETIASVPAAQGFYRWAVPDTQATAVFRLALPSAGPVLSDTFVVAPLPELKAGFSCPESFLLHWNGTPGRTYELYRLDGAYLQPFQQTTDTVFLGQRPAQPLAFFSVAPLIGERRGLRSYTINEATAAGCFLNGFFFTGRDGQAAGFTLQLGSVYGIEQLYFEKWEGGNFRPADSISLPDDLEYTFRDPALQQGRNDYRVRVRLSNGLEFLSSVESVYYTEASRPVLFFPNPAPALAAPRVVVPESGRYTLRIMDLSGRQVYRLLLTQSVTHLPAGFLPKGVYIAWIHDASGKAFSEKLILY